MVKTSPGSFAAFRGRSGQRRKTQILNFTAKYLGFNGGDLVQEYETIFNHVEKHEGRLQACKKAKSWYDVSLRLSSNLDFTPLPFTSADKDGYPKLLKKFRSHLICDCFDTRRAVLTILQLYKLVDSKGEPNLIGITAPYAGQQAPTWLSDYEVQLEKMFPSDQTEQRIGMLKPGYHISGKNGPNGPALGTIHVDRLAIHGTNIEDSCKELSLLTGFDTLYDLLSAQPADTYIKSDKGKEPCHSRLRAKHESGGKTRLFAIVDFFSQSSLKSIHTYCMHWLKTQSNDGTASHDSAAQAVKKWSAIPDIELFSYDLTEATNRWPLFLQWLVVKQMFGHRIADCWKDIISNREFLVLDGPDSVRFNCGQPLGALSSWAVFAISHHCLVRSAAYQSWKGKGPLRGTFNPSNEYDKYRIIGDDICIRDRLLATTYRSYLSDIAVDISTVKSVLPEQLRTNTPSGELAKRLFIGGNEITPVPPDAILIGSEPYGFRSLLEQCQIRDYKAAKSPYLVQSSLRFKEEFADLTFPFRNRLPLFKGLESYYEVRKSLNITSNMGSLNPHWFQWFDTPLEDVEDLVRTFLFFQVRKAEERSQEILTGLTYQTYGVKSYETDEYDMDGGLVSAPQGGDWKPDVFTSEPEVIRTVLEYVQEILNSVTDELYRPDWTNLDLYEFIGRIQVFLDPNIMIKGRKARDQKAGTRTYMSKIVKYCLKHINK
jgi:hypothetical protein